MHSGVATESRELVLGTLHHYNWVQISGAINHPEAGKIVDMKEACDKLNGRTDNYLKLYPVNGYGDEEILFQIMAIEKPDALMFFTDPRFWGFLFNVENQIRAKIPMVYLNIWDEMPYPMWNKPFYQCCDTLLSISKQTYNINKWILGPEFCLTTSGELDKEGKIIPFKQ